jgi:hypothetical protein
MVVISAPTRDMKSENLSGSHYSVYRKQLLSLIKELRQFGYATIVPRLDTMDSDDFQFDCT